VSTTATYFLSQQNLNAVMSNKSKHFYDFGEFRLDPRQRFLLRNGEIVPLKLRAVEMLIVLVEDRERVLSKEELMRLIWPDTIVEESNVTNNIHLIRQAIGTMSDGTEYIKNIPKRGYQFVGRVNEVVVEEPVERRVAIVKQDANAQSPVTVTGEIEEKILVRQIEEGLKSGPTDCPPLPTAHQAAGEQQPQGWQDVKLRLSRRFLSLSFLAIGLVALLSYSLFIRAPKTQTIKSIAVLPFRPLNVEKSDQSLELGMADTLITRMCNLDQVIVRPTSAIQGYIESNKDSITIGQELKVDAVLEGHIQKLDDRIRVTVQLLRVSDGKPIWSEQYDEQWTYVFALQDRIASQIAGKIEPQLVGAKMARLTKHYTGDPEAYRQYLLGRYFWSKRDPEQIKKAIDYFNQAVERDQNYALAYAGLADAYSILSDISLVSPKEFYPKARESALKALAIDDKLAEAHTSLAYVMAVYDWKWTEAETSYKRAIELNPKYATAHQWYGEYLSAMGRNQEAIAETRRALESDPTSRVINSALALALYYTHDYDWAIVQCRETIELDTDYAPVYQYLFQAYYQKGKYEAAFAAFLNWRKRRGESQDELAAWQQVYENAGWKGVYRRQLEKLLQHPNPNSIANSIAVLHALLKEDEQALDWLERAYAERSRGMMQLKVNPRLDNLRSYVRFQDLLRRVGLPQ